jgi:alpha-D-ribose 1-methylphosphonate 5-triphosphate synthase subunit PhnH
VTAPFDPVHDLQQGFRCLVEAFSFPGRLVDLSAPASAIVGRVGDPAVVPGLALGAAALVDQDAAYAVEGAHGLAAFLAEWSSRRQVAVGDAGVVAVSDFDDSRLAALLELVPEGTLADPHRGATVLVGVENLDEGDSWTVSGPGIEAPCSCVLPAGPSWTAVRARRTAEFPLGFDLAFFDRRGRVLALPRTTRLTAGRES